MVPHTHEKVNYFWIFAYSYILRASFLYSWARDTRRIVSTENVSLVLKCVTIGWRTPLTFSDNSDLIACMVVSKDGCQAQRFLAVDVYQMSLVEPETKRLGWGVVKFAGLLQVSRINHNPVMGLATSRWSPRRLASTGHAGVRCGGRQQGPEHHHPQAQLQPARQAFAHPAGQLHLRRPHPLHHCKAEVGKGTHPGAAHEDAENHRLVNNLLFTVLPILSLFSVCPVRQLPFFNSVEDLLDN